MFQVEDFNKVGLIKKPHGISGGLILKLNLENIITEQMESCFLKIDGGLVPFFFKEIIERDPLHFYVTFEWIDNQPAAQKLVGKEVFMHKDMAPLLNDDLNIIGFKIRDLNHGYIGTVQEIFENPQQKIMQILNDKEEIFVPVTETIIKEIIEEENEIVIDAPEGLIDLYKQ